MKKAAPTPPVARHNIASVERETGIGKDTLRVWERRYGFPVPERDQHDERSYSGEDLDKLRRVKRLIDQGHRPGKIFAASPEEWDAWLNVAPAQTIRAATPIEEDDLLKLLHMARRENLYDYLNGQLLRQGLQRFIIDTIAPLNTMVGDAWMRGKIEVSEEHLYTEQVQTLLRHAIAQRNDTQRTPRVLLTTLPDELHGLGILMAEALLVSEGAYCVSLGTRTPLLDIVRAVQHGNFDALALSFSAAFPQRHLITSLQTLNDLLPDHCEIWAGGRGLANARLPLIIKVRNIGAIEEVLTVLRNWRQKHNN